MSQLASGGEREPDPRRGLALPKVGLQDVRQAALFQVLHDGGLVRHRLLHLVLQHCKLGRLGVGLFEADPVKLAPFSPDAPMTSMICATARGRRRRRGLRPNRPPGTWAVSFSRCSFLPLVHKVTSAFRDGLSTCHPVTNGLRPPSAPSRLPAGLVEVQAGVEVGLEVAEDGHALVQSGSFSQGSLPGCLPVIRFPLRLDQVLGGRPLSQTDHFRRLNFVRAGTARTAASWIRMLEESVEIR